MAQNKSGTIIFRKQKMRLFLIISNLCVHQDTQHLISVNKQKHSTTLDFLEISQLVSYQLLHFPFPFDVYFSFTGAFLIVYFIAMTFCGIPIFFQEVAIGQYLGSGGMTLVAQLCPLLKGVGIATMVLVFFLDIYYCVIIAWTVFYMVATFSAVPDLPWDTCGNQLLSLNLWHSPTRK